MRDGVTAAIRAVTSRLSSSRLVVIGVVVTLVLGTAGFLIGRGETGLRLLIQAGDAWLPTNKDGSVTHVDGQTARPTAQLLLKGAAGHQLIVSKSGYNGDPTPPERYVPQYPQIMITWLARRGFTTASAR